jgi:hypothetical protein
MFEHRELAASPGCHVQPIAGLSPMSTQEEVLQADEARRAALLTSDAHALERCLASDYVMVHTSGRVESRASMLAAVRAGALDYRAIEVSESSIDELGPDLALQSSVVRQLVFVRGAAIELHVRPVSIWMRREGHWVLRFYQSTTIAPVVGGQ